MQNKRMNKSTNLFTSVSVRWKVAWVKVALPKFWQATCITRKKSICLSLIAIFRNTVFQYAGKRQTDRSKWQFRTVGANEKHFESFGKPAYRILKSTSERALQDAESFLAKHSAEKFDYVFFDLPGRADDTALVGFNGRYGLRNFAHRTRSAIACSLYDLCPCRAWFRCFTDKQ